MWLHFAIDVDQLSHQLVDNAHQYPDDDIRRIRSPASLRSDKPLPDRLNPLPNKQECPTGSNVQLLNSCRTRKVNRD